MAHDQHTANVETENRQLRSILRKLGHGVYRIAWDSEGAYLRGVNALVSTDDQNLFDRAISKTEP